MTNSLREKVRKIFKKWYANYGFEVDKGADEVIDSILRSIRVPEKMKPHEASYDEVDGRNTAIDEMIRLNGLEKK